MKLEDSPLISKFIDVFAYKGYLEWYNDERVAKRSDAILISDPSNICGIVYTNKVLEKATHDTGWTSYQYNGFKPSKKDSNYVLFEGRFYSCDFMLKTFNKFFKGGVSFDIRIASIPENDLYYLLIKIDGLFSLAIANIRYDVMHIEGDGVLFIKTKPEEINGEIVDKEISRHFIPWKNGKAIFEDEWLGGKWNRVVYNQDYLFYKQQEIGDSLLI